MTVWNPSVAYTPVEEARARKRASRHRRGGETQHHRGVETQNHRRGGGTQNRRPGGETQNHRRGGGEKTHCRVDSSALQVILSTDHDKKKRRKTRSLIKLDLVLSTFAKKLINIR